MQGAVLLKYVRERIQPSLKKTQNEGDPVEHLCFFCSSCDW